MNIYILFVMRIGHIHIGQIYDDYVDIVNSRVKTPYEGINGRYYEQLRNNISAKIQMNFLKNILYCII